MRPVPTCLTLLLALGIIIFGAVVWLITVGALLIWMAIMTLGAPRH
jgi:hypothetical protein